MDDRAGRKPVAGQVVVGHDDIHPERAGALDLVDGADAAVDRDDQVGALGGEPLYGGTRQAVSVLARRQVPARIGAQGA